MISCEGSLTVIFGSLNICPVLVCDIEILAGNSETEIKLFAMLLSVSHEYFLGSNLI